MEPSLASFLCSYHSLTELWATVQRILPAPEALQSQIIRVCCLPDWVRNLPAPLRPWWTLWRHPQTEIKRTASVLVIELIIISVLILSRPRLEISERVTGGWSARVIPILLTVKPCHSGEAGCAHRSPHRKYDPTKLVRERGLRRDPLVVVVMARRREAGMIVKLVRNLES